MTGDERVVLDHRLDLYRDTVLLKIAGLDGEQLARRAVPPSSLSLVGVVRHLTEVEAYWLRVVLLDDQEVPDYYCTPASPDGAFADVDPTAAAADVAAYVAGLTLTRANAAGWTDLDVPVRGLREGMPVNLRWILVHLVEEYAPPGPHGPASRGRRRSHRLLIDTAELPNLSQSAGAISGSPAGRSRSVEWWPREGACGDVHCSARRWLTARAQPRSRAGCSMKDVLVSPDRGSSRCE